MRTLFDLITRQSIRLKWLTLAITSLLMALGVYAASQLNVELLPPIDIPSTYILGRTGGGTKPGIMLQAYTMPIERSAAKIAGVVNRESNTTASFAFLEIRNEFGEDQDRIREDLQAMLNAIPLPVRSITPTNGLTPGDMLSDLTPDVVLYLYAFGLQENLTFLPQISPAVWNHVSPEVLGALPESAFDDLDPNLAATLKSRRIGQPQPVPTDLSPARAPALPPSWQMDRFETAADLAELTGVRNLADLFNDFLADGYLAGPLGTTADLTPADIALVRSYEEGCQAAAEASGTAEDDCVMLGLLGEELATALEADIETALGTQTGTYVPLPTEWRFEKPKLITFSFSDIPLARLSISASNNLARDDFRHLVENEIVPRLAALKPVADVTIEGGEEIPSDLLVAARQAEEAGLVDINDLASGDESEQLLVLNVPVDPRLHDADAPPLSAGWSIVAPYVGADELNTADDLFYTQGDNSLRAPSRLLNNFVGSDGEIYIGQLSAAVLLYIADCRDGKPCEPDFFNHLSSSLLALISDEAAAGLPDEVQARRNIALSEYRPDQAVTRTNGDNSLILNIRKNAEANTVAAWADVENVLDEFQEKHPNIDVAIVFEQASYIEESISGVAREGGLGAIMAVVVILIFLSFSVRSTLVTAVSIPTSVALAFVLMRWVPGNMHALLLPAAENASGTTKAFLDFILRLFPESISLNIMTLSGLTVAIGRVVDDAIVVLENIYRNIQKGENRLEAVLQGTRDVSLAIFAATVTTVVVFLPIGLFGGVIGAFFLPFGLAVTYALMSSFVVAITVVPLLAYLFIDKNTLPAEHRSRLESSYRGVIQWALAHRWTVIGMGTAAFAVGIVILSQLPTAFLPSFGEPTITVAVSLPAEINGSRTTIAMTDAKVSRLEDYLQTQVDGIKTIQTSVGSGGSNGLVSSNSVDENVATLSITVESEEVRDRLTPQIRQQAEAIFGVEYVTVSGASLSEQGFGGFAVVISGNPNNPPTLSELQAYDAEIVATLESMQGVTNVESSLERVTGSGGNISQTFIRIDGIPAVRYTAELETKDTLGLTRKAIETVKKLNLPENFTVGEGFESQQQTEGFQQTFVSMGIAVLIVYFVMVLTFGSLLHPVTILFSLPLATVGAAVGLAVTGRVLGLSSVVGLLMLVGIVVTNAIVLIDRVQTNRKQKGMSATDALVDGGATRLRPILMTAIATMVALLPLAIGLSEGAIIAAELGTVVIGGLFSSTLLTLIVVPVVYSLFDQNLAAVKTWLLNRRPQSETS